MRTFALFLALMLSPAIPTCADTLYRYESDPFRFATGAYEPGVRITGSFVLADSFVAPVSPDAGPNWANVIPSARSYSFTDGLQTLTQDNSTATIMMPFDRQTGQPTPAQTALVPQYTKLPPMAGWFVIDIRAPTGGFVVTTTQDWTASMWSGAETAPQFHFVTDATGGGHFEWDASPGVSAAHINSQFGAAQMGGFWGNWTMVSVPEKAILPRLPRLLKFGPGLGLEAAVTARLQRVTAWGATSLLHALQIPAYRSGVFIDLTRVRVEVAEACSGLQTVAFMLVAAGLLACVLPARRRAWAFALVGASILLALEANALRVAGIAIGLEQTAGTMAHTWKDWIQMGTTGFALAQLVGLGRLVAQGRSLPRPVTI
jgi:exosortase/archaeosortase family protein